MQNVERDKEIGQKGAFCKGLHLRRGDIYAAQEFGADYLADECCNLELVMPLRDAGHDLLI